MKDDISKPFNAQHIENYSSIFFFLIASVDGLIGQSHNRLVPMVVGRGGKKLLFLL